MRKKRKKSASKKYHGRPCKTCNGTERYAANFNCVPCSVKRTMASRAKRPEQWNAYATAARYAKMGLTSPIPPKRTECELCGSTGGGRGIALDHDHQTGQCRGWLCHNCNLGLGHFKDNPSLLRAAADYLTRQ